MDNKTDNNSKKNTLTKDDFSNVFDIEQNKVLISQ